MNPYGVPRVRIPPSPQRRKKPVGVVSTGFFCFWANVRIDTGCEELGNIENSIASLPVNEGCREIAQTGCKRGDKGRTDEAEGQEDFE